MTSDSMRLLIILFAAVGCIMEIMIRRIPPISVTVAMSQPSAARSAAMLLRSGPVTSEMLTGHYGRIHLDALGFPVADAGGRTRHEMAPARGRPSIGPGKVGGNMRPQWDFFVSYAQADRGWAEWIAWVLEESGYHVLIQAWDFVPGSNWMERIQAATRGADRTIAVLSEVYAESAYGAAEWQAAWASDPDGTSRKLLVTRIASCRRPGLLAGVVGADLFDVTEEVAWDRLAQMASAAASGRAKPAVAPGFPGAGRVVPSEPSFPGGSQLDDTDPRSRDGRSSEARPAGLAKLVRWRTTVGCPRL
jgi:TIR domain